MPTNARKGPKDARGALPATPQPPDPHKQALAGLRATVRGARHTAEDRLEQVDEDAYERTCYEEERADFFLSRHWGDQD